jgi:hypothetical protein
MTIDLLYVGLLDCVSQSKNDDERIYREHRKEPDVKNVGHSFPASQQPIITEDQLIGS